MIFLITPSSTTLAYWLQWKVLGCAIWVLIPIGVVCVLYRYKTYDHNCDLLSTFDETWMPFINQLNPIWLLVYRIIAFTYLVTLLAIELATHGLSAYFFYTQWTFTLVTIYFGYACVLSAYGCHRQLNQCTVASNKHDLETSVQTGTQVPLVDDEDLRSLHSATCLVEAHSLHWFLLQTLFQMSGGAVMVTDVVFWCILYPFFASKEYSPDFAEINLHSMNAVLLFGDAVINSLPAGWFGMSYVVLWTGTYVIFQWIFHAIKAIKWPYEILDLASPYAPLWYMAMALGHLLCYGFFIGAVNMTRSLLGKCFSQSPRGMRDYKTATS